MRPALALAIVAMGVGLGGAAWAAEASSADGKLQQIREALQGGNYDAAASDAAALARASRDDTVKTEAMRLWAAALRKKGDWAAAAKAYKDLAGCFKEGTEGHVKAEAAAEVLQQSPQGVYPPLVAASGGAGGGKSSALVSDDGVLVQALILVGEARAKKLDARVAAMKTTPTPQDVVKALREIIQGYAEARILAPSVSKDAEVAAVKAAGERMEALFNEAAPKLRAKEEEYRQKISLRRTVDSNQEKELTRLRDQCNAMADAEEQFSDLAQAVGGDWKDKIMPMRNSTKRTREYRAFATKFGIPLIVRPGWH